MAGGDPPVSDCMTRHPVTLPPSATLVEAEELMKSGDCRHVPVVDAGRIVGMLSDRDLRRAAGRGDPRDTPIGARHSGLPITADPDEPLSRAARRMTDQKISALPVEYEGALVGILTVTDVLGHCARIFAAPPPEH
jgi:acetoin utilization protein AcuB